MYTYKTAAQSVLKNGYGILPIDLDLDPEELFLGKCQTIVESFQNFNTYSIGYRDRFTFDLSENKKPAVGFLRRDDEEHKNIFDYYKILPRLLKFRNVELENGHSMMCVYMKNIHRMCYQMLLRFSDEMDRQLPGYNFVSRVSSPASKEIHLLRTLQYDPVGATKNMHAAVDHTDKDLFTIPVFSTHKGLWLGHSKNIYTPKENHLVIFAGQKAQLLTGAEQHYIPQDGYLTPHLKGGQIQALKHGVTLFPRLYGRGYERSSIVFFGHDADTIVQPKIPIQK